MTTHMPRHIGEWNANLGGHSVFERGLNNKPVLISDDEEKKPLRPLFRTNSKGGKKEKKRPFSGRWFPLEENLFDEALARYGKGNWKVISQHVGTRTPIQCKTHNQKIEQKARRAFFKPSEKQVKGFRPTSQSSSSPRNLPWDGSRGIDSNRGDLVAPIAVSSASSLSEAQVRYLPTASKTHLTNPHVRNVCQSLPFQEYVGHANDSSYRSLNPPSLVMGANDFRTNNSWARTRPQVSRRFLPSSIRFVLYDPDVHQHLLNRQERLGQMSVFSEKTRSCALEERMVAMALCSLSP